MSYIGVSAAPTPAGVYTKAETNDLVASVDLTSRVAKSGDTMTGNLIVDANVGIGATSPTYKLTVQSGLYSILAGADSGTLSLTDATQKVMRFGVPHYTNAERPVAGMFVSNLLNENGVFIGGGTGVFNAATRVSFYTAANTTTTTGSERMRIDSAGRVTMPYQPFFFGRLPASTSKPAGWNFPATHYTDVVINRGSHYNTSNGLFTCPVAGDYSVSCGGFWGTGGNGQRVGPAIDKNGSAYQIVGGQLCDGDSPFPVSTVIVPCSAGDTLRVGQIYSPNTITTGGSGFYSFFTQIHLIS